MCPVKKGTNMNKIFRTIYNFILPNITLVLALTLGSYVVLDWYNPMMEFLQTWVSIRMLMLLCVLCVVLMPGRILHFFRKTSPDKDHARTDAT